MLPGKPVGSEKEIKPYDISNDGSMTYFIGPDDSFIIGKAWNMDGTIRSVKFVPEKLDEVSSDLTLDDIADQLDRIENLLMKKPRKKEGITDG